MVWYSLAPELNARVVSFSYELCFKAQLEVAIFFLAYEEFVVGNLSVKESGNDGPVFNPEEIFLAFPSVQCLAVEKRDETFVFFLLFATKAASQEKKEQGGAGFHEINDPRLDPPLWVCECSRPFPQLLGEEAESDG